MESKVAFYESLKDKLNEQSNFPSLYLFKFIVPNRIEKINAIEILFKEDSASIQKTNSKSNKYTSISIKMEVESADFVIAKYKEVEQVEGVISL